ncbi:MAG TPA: chorismate mutase [Flavisolibacter sp.]
MQQQSVQHINVSETLRTRPLIISGPCSAETEEQVLDTAMQLAANGRVHILRAGIWKPRTRPGSFEGVGSVGLQWLQAAKKQTGMPIAVEVANARQVEEAVQHDVDVLWIGARTTVNPFSVQELADALRGVGKPVLIKNPLNPDIELWMGAVERIAAAGVTDIVLVHRGFSSYGNTMYRNAPMWHLAIEMKRRYPELAMLNDPSHICGRRDILLSVAQKAIDLGYDGLMIESHTDPDNAWSDALQQVTPERLSEMLGLMVWRQPEMTEASESVLEQLREKIDHLDDELLHLISQRMRIADIIGGVKKENNISILQTRRWNDILQRAYEKADALGLSREFITRYFDAIHLESINHQTKVFNS